MEVNLVKIVKQFRLFHKSLGAGRNREDKSIVNKNFKLTLNSKWPPYINKVLRVQLISVLVECCNNLGCIIESDHMKYIHNDSDERHEIK